MGGFHSVYVCLREEGKAAAHMLSAVKKGADIIFTSAQAGPPAPLGLTSGQAHTTALPQEEAAALLLLLPVLRDPAQTPALSPDSQTPLKRDGSKFGTSPSAGVPEC